MDGALRSYRRRLPNRRKAITETIVIGNMTLTATIGFDETGRPKSSWPAPRTAREWPPSSMMPPL
jgi:hypothetical protein